MRRLAVCLFPLLILAVVPLSAAEPTASSTGHFLVRGHHTGAYGIVYPVVISPAWKLFSSIPNAYAAAKTIGSIVMSLTAIPVYLLARRVLSPLPSLLAATTCASGTDDPAPTLRNAVTPAPPSGMG